MSEEINKSIQEAKIEKSKIWEMMDEARTVEELNEKVREGWKQGIYSFNLTENERKLIPRNERGEETNGWESPARIKRGRILPFANDMTDEELDWFVEDLEYYWKQGLGADDIIKEMGLETFGLKRWQIYYAAKRLGLKKRHKFKQKVLVSED